MQERTLPPPAAAISTKLIVGLFLTTVGVLLTLDNFDVVDGDDYLVWWPMVLVLIGIVKIVQGGNRVIAAVLIVVGAWLTAVQHDVIDVGFFQLWPLLLIGFGAVMVARAAGFAPKTERDDTSSPNVWAVLSSRNIVETSRDFDGRRYYAFLGGCEIDFTNAEMTQKEATIETYAVWGGIEIDVPYEWEVVGEVVPVMGGFEVKLRPSSGVQKRLIIRGFAVMGGVEVKSAPRRAA